MAAKDLKSDSTIISTINDGNTNFDHSSITLLTNRNKSYSDIESNSLGKVETTQGSRPCAIIGPDRVQPPPTASDAHPKKASVEPWPSSDTIYQLQAEISQKLPDYQSMRNISPRQTFQENMQRIMVPPSYHSAKNIDDNILRSSKVDMPLEVKYCDVPYTINPIANNQKSIRPSDVPMTSPNSPYITLQRHAWTSTVAPRPQRPYGTDFYQYPEVANYSGPRPLQRVHRQLQDDPAQGHTDRLYNDASVRFKPYPNNRDRYPHPRYDYVSNYPNTYHPQLPFPPPKYDISKTLPSHPYHMYPQVPMRRVPDPIIDPYQRPNQPNFNPYQNQYIPQPYGPVQGNYIPSKMYPYPQDMSPNAITPSKLPYDVNNKMYVDYENAKNKMFSSVDNMPYYNDPKRQHLKNDITLPMQPAVNMHHIPQHHLYRKDNVPIKQIESPHPNSYAMPHHLHFSPSLARSPIESFPRMDTFQSIGSLQEDCGYVSQSSTASSRSMDSGNFRIQNEIYKKSESLYGNGSRNSQKPRSNSVNSPDKKGLDVRQFLQMWNEGDEEVSDPTHTSASANTQSENNPEQLVILGSMTIPNEELSKYEHIQKISKLPENIKGFNSIELLDQYEQLVETPAIRYNKKPMSYDYQSSLKLAKQSSLIPRPLSPLDVEAKISQSVIHKEVGCNFEIKPCSPKMMNVELATPLQNIINERTIEKVINTSVTNSQILPSRTDNASGTSPLSCKMNTTFMTNEDLIKNNNYSLQDLESNSGVCLASLPRLDSDIELNFPEINQQFIDANRCKISTTKEDLRATTAQTLLKSDNDCDRESNDRSVQTPEPNSVETAKLSKYRKVKTADSLPSEARTDSVIIKNPEPLRKKDIYDAGDMQDKSNGQDIESDIQDNTSLKDMSCSAIDFSLNKLTESSEVNADTEHFMMPTDLKTEDMPTKDENETQIFALSLVTKKVEMELKEFELNDYNTKREAKHSGPGFSLGLICEDTAVLPVLDTSDTMPVHSNILKENKSLTDVSRLIPYTSQTDLEEEIQFEREKESHKDEDIFKDDIVIAALREHNIVSREVEKNHIETEKETVSIENRNLLCSVDTNENLEPKINSDLVSDCYMREDSVLSGNLVEKPVECGVEVNKILHSCKQVNKNTVDRVRSPDRNQNDALQTKNIEDSGQINEIDSFDKMFNHENENLNLPETTFPSIKQNAESIAATIESSDKENDLVTPKNEKTSSLSILHDNLIVETNGNKPYFKKDITNADSERKNIITDYLNTSLPDIMLPTKNEIDNKHDILMQENFMKNNLVCTTPLEIPLDIQKCNIGTLEESCESPKLQGEGDSSKSNYDLFQTSYETNHKDLPSEIMAINETKSGIQSCFQNHLLQNEVTEDELKYNAFNNTVSTSTEKNSKRKRCSSKEYFSPWMQKLFLYSSGLCEKLAHENNEDMALTSDPTNIQSNSTIAMEVDCKTINDLNLNLIVPSTHSQSQDVIETKTNTSNLLSKENTESFDVEPEEENMHNFNGENIESASEINTDINYVQNNLNVYSIFSPKNNVTFPKRIDLKRSLSDSAIDLYSDDGLNKVSSKKRRRLIIENFIESSTNEKDISGVIENNRRKSISAICNNDNLLILIHDNEYIIAEEDCETRNVEFVDGSTEFLQVTENAYDIYEVHRALENDSVPGTTTLNGSPITLNDNNDEKWLGADSYMEDIFNDDVAVDITISAPISPDDSNLSSNDSICTDNESDHIARIEEIYEENMCINNMNMVDTLSDMPSLNIDKTPDEIESHNLIYNDTKEILPPIKKENIPIVFHRKIENCNDNDIYDNIILKNCESRDKESPIKINDSINEDYEYNGDNGTIPCESIHDCTSLASCDSKHSASSSPEVSSTTSEDKCSSILLKITSVNGSRRSEINNISTNLQQIRYKYTEKNDYNTNYRPLITKAAQKYIPPIIESNDLKVKLPLPQNSLNKLKQLKLAQNEAVMSIVSKHKKNTVKQDVCKKVKPKFEDVLKSIDEIQFKMHKDKCKKTKHSIPKVLIKKHENGAHYASTPEKGTYNPDLTGRKWQPWVFIEKNDFVDRMAQRNKHKAVYCRRKKTYVLEEKFKKYKSICTAKFVISQPTSDHTSSGNLKYTIRLKHNY